MRRCPKPVWLGPPDVLKTLPGYDSLCSEKPASSTQIIEKLATAGPPAQSQGSARNIPTFRREPAVILD